MVALYRSGRQADALAVYHDLPRRRSTDELGLEPIARGCASSSAGSCARTRRSTAARDVERGGAAEAAADPLRAEPSAATRSPTRWWATGRSTSIFVHGFDLLVPARAGSGRRSASFYTRPDDVRPADPVRQARDGALGAGRRGWPARGAHGGRARRARRRRLRARRARRRQRGRADGRAVRGHAPGPHARRWSRSAPTRAATGRRTTRSAAGRSRTAGCGRPPSSGAATPTRALPGGAGADRSPPTRPRSTGTRPTWSAARHRRRSRRSPT